MSRMTWMAGIITATVLASAGCNKSADHAASDLKDAKQGIDAAQKAVNQAQTELTAGQAQLDSAHSAADSARVRLNQQIRRDTTIRH